MKRLVIPIGLLAMAVVVAVAFVWDCVRIDGDHREQVALADADLQRNEDRLVQALRGLGEPSPALQVAIDAHASAKSRDARHTAYGRLRAEAEQALTQVKDPNQPAARKVIDDVSGAINRRRVAEQAYQQSVAALDQWRGTFRGATARRFHREDAGE